jgi:hypothetical protein
LPVSKTSLSPECRKLWIIRYDVRRRLTDVQRTFTCSFV